MMKKILLGCLLWCGVTTGSMAIASDVLPYWHESPSKAQIIDFVTRVTDPTSAAFVPVSDRIAVFDNDGTLWSEQPIYGQLAFLMDRIKAQAPDHPEWQTTQPFKAVLEGDLATLKHGGTESLLPLLAATHAGMTSDAFRETVSTWLASAKHPKAVYRFLADELGTTRVQFNPAVEPKFFKESAPAKIEQSTKPMQDSPRAKPDHPLSVVTPWTVDPDDYGTFLSGVWDEWLATDFGRVHVNLFETAIAQAAGLPAQTCTQAEISGKGLAVEHDGEVFSCDNYVYPQYRIGNIKDTHLGDLAFSKAQESFGTAKRDTLPKQCRQCDYLRLCWGECPKNRIIKTRAGESGLNYLCSGLYAFYQHIGPDVVRILRHLGYLKT